MDKYEYKNKLCDSLLRWLQTFHLDAPHSIFEDIMDGVLMAQSMNQMAPEWFTEAWLCNIKTASGDWRLKVTNLRKIMEGISDYYQDYLNQPLADFAKPDVRKLGDRGDAAEVGKLRLLLGCAVNCSNKQDYITGIMSVEESDQCMIMQSIQELETLQGHGAVGFTMGMGLAAEAQKPIIAELQAAAEARHKMAQRCRELEMQVSRLQEEKAGVVEENKRLMDRLRDSIDNPITSSSQLRR